MKLGIDILLEEDELRRRLRNQRVAVLGHPASMTGAFEHTLDALARCQDIHLVAAFGPQHGMRGDLQDNMMESKDYVDAVLDIPVFSLYAETRRLTSQMLDAFDVLLVDLQDVGCRIYTFLTTVMYLVEDCARAKKSLWILDRPNPAGRPIEGRILQPGWQSFVGHAPLPIRHGLTLGEAALWFQRTFGFELDLTVVKMRDYDPTKGPGYGWPLLDLPWVNPSPNASNLSMARAFAGTVMIEGTELSEGRGTTRPLELMGAPDLEPIELLSAMKALAENWLQGCLLRPCYFSPTFHKHQGRLCRGIQIHVDDQRYQHDAFRPFRLVAAFLRALRGLHSHYRIWRQFEYEYEKERLAIDLITGSHELREWVDGLGSAQDFDALLRADELAWRNERRRHLLYPE